MNLIHFEDDEEYQLHHNFHILIKINQSIYILLLDEKYKIILFYILR